MSSNKSLYPDILFHFTTCNGLKRILEHGFSISYAREKIVGLNSSTEFAVPMVAFCDLRLSELKFHMSKYGNYGIGLTKEWANKNYLNPVFYVNKDSSYTGDFIDAIKELFKQLNLVNGIENLNTANSTYMKIMNTYRYMKNYEADLKRNGKKTILNYRFADEREWRFVPSINENNFPFTSTKSVSTKEKKTKLNSLFSHLKLEFKPNDIKYIIVESERSILPLIKHLEKVKGDFDEKTRRRLISRILTTEQIRNDI